MENTFPVAPDNGTPFLHHWKDVAPLAPTE
jgi:hypothetical protein